MDRPSILIVNDDSIFAEGIRALWEAMSEIGDTTVVAPKAENSGVGQAITISKPLRIEEVHQSGDFSGFAVHGTPADSVKIAVKVIMNKKPDIILSGINAGPNYGQSIFYSGTVSAAREGTFLGIPSVAISLGGLKDYDYSGAKNVSKKIAKLVLKKGLPADTLLNVTVPNISEDKYKGFKVTHQGGMYFEDNFEKRTDPRGNDYYWLTAEHVDPDTDMQSDRIATKNGFISVTPLHSAVTNYNFLEDLSKWEIDE